MDYGAFWGALLGSGIVGIAFSVGLKFLLDNRLERQKKELAKELFEDRISIESQIDGIDKLLQATRDFRDVVSLTQADVAETSAKIGSLEEGLSGLSLALGSSDYKGSIDSAKCLGLKFEQLKDELLQNFEKKKAEFVSKGIIFVNAMSDAQARMKKAQRDEITRLVTKCLSEFSKTNFRASLVVLNDLRKFLENESRQLRKIEETKQ